MANPSYENIEKALKRAWFPVARSMDVSAPYAASLLGEKLVVFRTSAGEPAVTDRRCPHRGGDLSLGQVVESAIECPYHGWRYASDGICVAIPALGENATIPSNARITPYPAVEKYGLVWTCLGEPIVDVPQLPELDRFNMKFMPGPPVDTNAGILSAAENFRDVAHFPFVHKKLMGNVAKEVERLKVRSEGFETWLSRTYFATGGTSKIYQDKQDTVFNYHAVMPALVSALLDEGETGHRVSIECFSPQSASGGCRVFMISGLSDDYVGATDEEGLEAEMGVLLEDKPMMDTWMPAEVPLHNEALEISISADRYTLTTREAYLRFVEYAMAAENETSVGADLELTYESESELKSHDV